MLVWLWNMLFVCACVLSKTSTSIRHAVWARSFCLPYGTLRSSAGGWLATLSSVSSALLREFIYILWSFSCMSHESLTDISRPLKILIHFHETHVHTFHWWSFPSLYFCILCHHFLQGVNAHFKCRNNTRIFHLCYYFEVCMWMDIWNVCSIYYVIYKREMWMLHGDRAKYYLFKL